MAERRRGKKKKELELKDDDDKPTKIEYAIAKYLRDKLPPKKTTLMSHKVEYFIASKAVDCLLDSPWAKSTKGEVVFTNRESVVEYLDRMLAHKLFHRAKKIIVQKDGAKKKKDEEESMNEEESSSLLGKKERKKKDLKKVAPKTPEKEEEGNKEKEGKKEEGAAGQEKKKEKKKIKLDMHLEQIFVDGNEPYVWIYDPIPVRAWVIGTLLVIGAVLICLFPLWPKPVRHYVYYLSLAAAGFLVLIIALAILRLVVFVLVWVFSLGKHHLWLLPKLTEDVGFFESFWPLYHYEYKGTTKDDGTTAKKKKKHPSGDESVPLIAASGEKAADDDSSSEHEPKEPHPTPADEGSAPSHSDESDQGSEKNSQGSTGESFEIIGQEEPEDAFHKNDTNIAKEGEEEGLVVEDAPAPKDT